MTIANCRSKSSSSYEFKKDKGETKKSSKPSKASTKETMVTSTEELVRISGKPRMEEKKGSSLRDVGRKGPTLKELQDKKYPFPYSDLSGMLDGLLENRIIELPSLKWPKEAGRTIDLKYYRHHRVINNPLEKCITLKERIMQLAEMEGSYWTKMTLLGPIIFLLKWNTPFHHGSKALCNLTNSERLMRLPPREKVHSPFSLEAWSPSLFP